jgi:hypothetical protein
VSKYFNHAKQWSEQNINIVGLPRPFEIIPKNFKPVPSNTLKLKNGFYLHPTIPIPWQSKPVWTEQGGVFNVIEEHEKIIYSENLCGYCGILIEEKEKCLRWLGSDSPYIPNDKQGPRVFSDTHPLHVDCMKQARIFCPYMRERPNEEFESGSFNVLKQNAIADFE